MNYSIYEIIKFISLWQIENDSDFTVLPNDDHSSLIFNHKNQIYKFVFSNKHKRELCRLRIPHELLNEYKFMIEQEDGFTYYSISKGDFR